MSEALTHRTMCPMNCHPTQCGMEVTTRDGQLEQIRGDKANPDSQGFLCVRGQAAHEIIGNPKRVLAPMLRDRRGGGDWREVSWDEALDHIAGTIDRVGRPNVAAWAGHGSIANDYGVFANVQLAMRFANMLGAQWWEGSMICWGLGGFGIGLTGCMEVNTKEDMGENADMILLWGSNIASQPNTSRHLTKAKKRGAHIVAIDVRESEACRLADETFIVRPGSDAALALAMMHVICAEGLQDDAFIDEHTLGFQALREHVAAYTPEWAAAQTGIDAGRIVALARRYAGTARAMINISGSSMYKDGDGWMASRAISCLPPLTGKLGKPGTGFGPRHAGNAHGFGLGEIINFQARPEGDYIPAQMSEIIDAIEGGRIRAMLVLGSNMMSSFADASRIGRGLDNMDMVVCHDLFMNETARRSADVFLPATAWLEDIGCKGTTTHIYLMDRILAPAGQARSMTQVVRALAERLGIEGFYPWADETGHIDAVLDHPATGHATVESLRAAGGMTAMNISHVAHIDHQYATPSGRIEFFSQRAADCGLPAMPEPPARRFAGGQFPLELRMGRNLNHFHSFYDHGRALPSLAKLEPEPIVWLAPADAAARGLDEGGAIRVRNDRGEMQGIVKISPTLPPGTVWTHDGWPGLNTLTSGAEAIPVAATRLFPFTSGQAGYDAFVEVEAR